MTISRCLAVALLVWGFSPAWVGAEPNTPLVSQNASPTDQPTPDAAPPLPNDATVRLFHTLATDFFVEDDGTTYVETGDIPAMWLRDSSAQLDPYIRFAPGAPQIAQTARGVIERNAKNILVDAYANAFTAGFKVWEEKWEVDSLSYPIREAWQYWQATHDRRIFTARFQWAMIHVLETYGCEQLHSYCSTYRTRFLPNGGSGEPFVYTGMIWSAFRPSDDPVRYPYNIPQQVLAETALDELADLEIIGYRDEALAARARELASQIRYGIVSYGTVYQMGYGWLYAYEVDGLGGYVAMDDANVPSLLSLPYFSAPYGNEPAYLATRTWVLSPSNPYYYTGKYASGEGSPHTPTGWVWPLGLIAQALTATDPQETRYLMNRVRATSGAVGLIHESFNPDAPWRFTRESFGWANALDAELAFRAYGGFAPQPGSAATPVLYEPPQSWEYAAKVSRAAELIPLER